jgi:hypothetical protein
MIGSFAPIQSLEQSIGGRISLKTFMPFSLGRQSCPGQAALVGEKLTTVSCYPDCSHTRYESSVGRPSCGREKRELYHVQDQRYEAYGFIRSARSSEGGGEP